MEKEVDMQLLIDEEDAPIIIEEECVALKPIIKDFVECYAENKGKPIEEWLGKKLQESLPEKTPEEVQSMTAEIITTIQTDEDNKASLAEATANGRSKESWFASEAKKATSAMSTQKSAEYLHNLDTAVHTANESLYRTITTQAGVVSQNPRLDGFIAEQYHAQTFNLNAEATGSQYRAKVLEPTGNGYAKNSVDVVIVDGNNKVVKRYQSKYCKDADATAQAFEQGDYRGQQKLVPEGQDVDIAKRTTTVLEAPDGTTSTALTKSQAKELQNEAQSGKWNDLNWNEYQSKDLAIGIGKQAGQADLMGVAVGVGFDVAQKVWNGEKIDGAEIVETAIVSGADFGVKSAAAGAIKVGVEKGIISAIPKGTPAGTIANIAFIAVEDAKVMEKMATGELSFKEGVEKIEQTTVAATAGLATMGEGAAIGAAVGAILGPVGAVIGGFAGGAIGYMAGSKVGETIVKGVQKIREKAKDVVKSIGRTVGNAVSTVARGISNICSGVRSLFSW